MAVLRRPNLDDLVNDAFFLGDDSNGSEMFSVPERRIDGAIVVPEIRMGRLEWFDDRARAGLEAYKTAPSAEELLHAMEVSKDYLKNVIMYPNMAEWTSTFIILKGAPDQKGYRSATVIHRPKAISGSLESGLMIEGGRKVETLLPPKGWYVPVNGQLWTPEGIPTATIAASDKTPQAQHEARVKAVKMVTEGFGVSEKTAEYLASMLYFKDDEISQYVAFQVARVNGKHSIGRFRFGLYPVGVEPDGAEWFKLRYVERERISK